MAGSKTILKWPNTAIKRMLKWVDDNKSQKEKDVAIEELTAHLRPGFLNDYNLNDNDQQSRVEGKLMRLWKKYRLPVHKDLQYTALLEQGVELLDQAELGADFGDLFASEGPVDQTAAANTSPSTVSQAGTKRKFDDAETPGEALEDGHQSPKRAKSTEGTRSEKPAVSTADSPDLALVKGGAKDTLAALETQTGVFEPPQERTSIEKEVVPDTHAQTTTIDSPPLQADNNPKAATGNIAAETNKEPLSQQPPKPQKTKKVPQIPSELLQENKVRFTLDKEINFDMNKLLEKVGGAVDEYLESTELVNYQPVILDPLLAYPHELNEVLKMVLGSASIRDMRIQRFNALQQIKNVGYASFIRSLLAATITRWCFERSPHAKELFEVWEGKIVEAVHEHREYKQNSSISSFGHC